MTRETTSAKYKKISIQISAWVLDVFAATR
jgi:hypothetical protein